MELVFAIGQVRLGLFQSLKGFGGLWNFDRFIQFTLSHCVSIPERVWWFVEPSSASRKDTLYRIDGVSIPERVWWFVEPVMRLPRFQTHSAAWFQSLKGFGGLWNITVLAAAAPTSRFQSLKGFGGLWNSV